MLKETFENAANKPDSASWWGVSVRRRWRLTLGGARWYLTFMRAGHRESEFTVSRVSVSADTAAPLSGGTGNNNRFISLLRTERYQIVNAIAAVPIVAVCIVMLNGNYHPVAVTVLSLPLAVPIWVFARKLTGRPVGQPHSQ